MKRNKTFSLKASQIKKDAYLVDAKDMILGRLAVEIARILRGKNKPDFTPHLDCGDRVVVINASRIKLSSDKENKKTYFRHSGYPHGAKVLSFKEMMKRDPRQVIRLAVAGMLPKGRLGRAVIKNMQVFKDEKHSYSGELKKV